MNLHSEGVVLGATVLLCLAVLAGAGIAIYHVAEGAAEARKKFMTQCVEDRKKYECVAMWRAGETSHNAAVVPFVLSVPVGGRR